MCLCVYRKLVKEFLMQFLIVGPPRPFNVICQNAAMEIIFERYHIVPIYRSLNFIMDSNDTPLHN